MAQRFSKAVMVESCEYLATAIASVENFTDRTGTSQLQSAGYSRSMNSAGREREDELIRRAVEYGRMKAFQSMAHWVTSGNVPLPPGLTSEE